MAEIEFLIQGLREGDDHGSAVDTLLNKEDVDQFLFSLAFVRQEGVSQIAESLNRVSDSAVMFVGIRNGVTSVQGIAAILSCGIAPYVVDTASSSKIFHPKIYSAYSQVQAHIILGSANLTFGGLNRNIEASSVLNLDRAHAPDEEFLQKLLTAFQDLPNEYPDHVFQISNVRQAIALMRDGRLEDERVTRLAIGNRVEKGRNRDALRPIPTLVKNARRTKKTTKRATNKTVLSARTGAGVLMWESRPLTERSLNIPRNENTHITGDTNFGMGAMEGIDFQHYFRDDVFNQADWTTDASSPNPHLERTLVDVELIIKSISYGVFKLEVTHDPRTDTRSYEQRNTTTKLKWGKARELVAKQDLLGRTLKLYRRADTEFTIVID